MENSQDPGFGSFLTPGDGRERFEGSGEGQWGGKHPGNVISSSGDIRAKFIPKGQDFTRLPLERYAVIVLIENAYSEFQKAARIYFSLAGSVRKV
jgi:hypothetical protein